MGDPGAETRAAGGGIFAVVGVGTEAAAVQASQAGETAHGRVGTFGARASSSVAESAEGLWACAGEALEPRALAEELRAREVLPDGDASAPPPTTATLFAGVSAGRGPLAGAVRLHGEVAWAALGADGALRAGTDGGGSRALHAGSTAHGGYAVASAPGVLLASGVAGAVDTEALAGWVEHGRFSEGRTPWRHVRRFRGGQTMQVRAGEPPAWSAVVPARNPGGAGGSTERWARSLGYAIALAVRRRAAPDRTVAVAMGEGAVAEGVLRLAAERRSAPLVVVVLDTGRADLAGIARRAAETGARLVRVPADAGALAQAAEEARSAMDVPVGPVEAASWLLARAASDAGAAVLLTGMGATETLGGDAGLVGEGARGVARGLPAQWATWLGGAGESVLRGALRGVEPPAPRIAVSTEPVGFTSLGAVLEARQSLLGDTWLPALDLACNAQGVEARHAPSTLLLRGLDVRGLDVLRGGQGIF